MASLSRPTTPTITLPLVFRYDRRQEWFGRKLKLGSLSPPSIPRLVASPHYKFARMFIVSLVALFVFCLTLYRRRPCPKQTRGDKSPHCYTKPNY